MTSNYYTPAELAERLKVSKMTVYRMIHSEWSDFTIRVGNSYRVRKDSFDYWEKMQ